MNGRSYASIISTLKFELNFRLVIERADAPKDQWNMTKTYNCFGKTRRVSKLFDLFSI